MEQNQKKITEAIVNFIIMDNKSFSTVEGKGFIQLMREVCPLYKVPCREAIKVRIDEKYEAMSQVFKTYIKMLKAIASLTTFGQKRCKTNHL